MIFLIKISKLMIIIQNKYHLRTTSLE